MRFSSKPAALAKALKSRICSSDVASIDLALISIKERSHRHSFVLSKNNKSNKARNIILFTKLYSLSHFVSHEAYRKGKGFSLEEYAKKSF